MARLKPSVSSYARVAYARELLGNHAGARAALLLARDAAADEREPLAWTEWQLGKLELGARAARRRRGAPPRIARARSPATSTHSTRLHRSSRARARRRTRSRSSAARSNDPAAAVRRPATATCCTRPATARRAPCSTRPRTASAGCFAANGVRTDLETALFDVDHGIRLRASLALARPRSASGRRSTATTCSAWALARNGRCGEALRYSKLALRLGTKDAPKLFHRARSSAASAATRAAVGAPRARAQPALLGALGPDR